MSERTTTAIYLSIAFLNFLVTCWKTLALLRERTTTLALITTSFATSVLVYVVASPVGYRFVGEVMGRPSFATLPVYVGIVICYAITHVLTLLWTPVTPGEHRSVHRRALSWSAAYGAAIVLMGVTFSAADLTGPADPMRFNTAFVQGEPLVLAFLLVFLSAFSCATLNTARLGRRTVPDDPSVQHSVACFSIAMVIVFGYIVCNVPAIALAAAGNHSLDGIGVLGSVFGTVGTFVTSYGMSGAAIGAWLRERRDSRALQPLWRLVVAGVDEKLALGPGGRNGLRLVNVRFTLHRRVIEILDGMRVLRAWSSPLAEQSVRRLAVALGDDARGLDLDAITTAATLRDAMARLSAARLEAAGAAPVAPGPPHRALPGERTAASDERRRLLLVARHLDHPLVAAALRDVRRREQPQDLAPVAGGPG
ncbi:MAB_1171c family putative transporter [Streptomyces sp. NPDC015350]|uniref:MAB_1171c family putative transporter n=1 Tax=Streptomyces sp. NPDC015350 TaxID=3364955 RepID=UPI0036F846C3